MAATSQTTKTKSREYFHDPEADVSSQANPQLLESDSSHTSSHYSTYAQPQDLVTKPPEKLTVEDKWTLLEEAFLYRGNMSSMEFAPQRRLSLLKIEDRHNPRVHWSWSLFGRAHLRTSREEYYNRAEAIRQKSMMKGEFAEKTAEELRVIAQKWNMYTEYVDLNYGTSPLEVLYLRERGVQITVLCTSFLGAQLSMKRLRDGKVPIRRRRGKFNLGNKYLTEEQRERKDREMPTLSRSWTI